MSTVVDVHTHMMSQRWFDLLKLNGGPSWHIGEVGSRKNIIMHGGRPFLWTVPEMFDWELRIKNMNRARVDVAVVSLTCPNVYWGNAENSTAAAISSNDDLAQAQITYPDRIRWFASLPWQHEEQALKELIRVRALGASGIMVLANIVGKSLTDESFHAIWKAIDEANLPVFVHPTIPPGAEHMDLVKTNLVPSIGFALDTTLAIARCIQDGFFERYSNIRVIAAHGGGALPFLIGRLDICYERIATCREHAQDYPRNAMRRIFLDTVVFTQEALEMCIKVVGPDNVLFGSDYPHNIGDMVGCLSRVDNLPADTRHLVRGGNAAKMFGL